jgi:hypothetical protein
MTALTTQEVEGLRACAQTLSDEAAGMLVVDTGSLVGRALGVQAEMFHLMADQIERDSPESS